MKKRQTIKQIAEQLNVSISTVSKALKNSDEISDETKKRIQEYVAKTGYTPNSLAIRLRSKKTLTVGVIVPELVHHFFTKVISGVENRASQYGYNVLVSLSKDRLENEKKIVEVLSSGYVDGLLISLAKETLEKQSYEHLQRLINNDFPIVFFDRVPQDLAVDKIIINDMEGGYIATKHLIDKKAQKIAILTTPPHITVGKDRENGYKKALIEANYKVQDELILRIDERQPIKEQIEFLICNYQPDGIFAVNENYASLALKVAIQLGKKIPDEIKIIGFTDGVISKNTTPTLTTVAQHGFEMGERAMEVLLERIENKKFFNQQIVSIIKTNLVKREST